LTFFVEGEPAPQGSKRHVGGGRMIEASKKVGPWRVAVKETVARLDFVPFSDAVDVSAIFYIARGKTVKRRWPIVPPDLDKLLRGLLDALTIANVWLDDSLVISFSTVEKRYADEEDFGRTGVFVTVLDVSDLT
jgi:crossover junction endodeoxyribonuclease RusA